MMNPTISQIPLNQLVPAHDGVRKVKNKDKLVELAASIKAR